MTDESRQILLEFVERAKYVEGLSYFKGGASIAGLRVVPKSDGQAEVDFFQPNDEARDAVVLHLRLFLQDKDRISMRSLTKLYDDPEVSDLWKAEHAAIRARLNAKLDRVFAERAGARLLYRDALNAVLFGKLAHQYSDHPHSKLYKDWAPDDGATQFLHSGFHTAVIWVSAAVMNVSRASQEELAREGRRKTR